MSSAVFCCPPGREGCAWGYLTYRWSIIKIGFPRFGARRNRVHGSNETNGTFFHRGLVELLQLPRNRFTETKEQRMNEISFGFSHLLN